MSIAVAEAAPAAARTAGRRAGHGRTQQGYAPSPGSHQRGRVPGRTRAAASSASPAKPARPKVTPQMRSAHQAQRSQARGQQQQARAQAQRRSDRDRRLRQGARQAAPTTPANRGNYQTAVLAEFIAAVILVAATPFAKKDSPGISPYVATDLMQLMAVTIVYFILALVSGVSKDGGRIAAWLGGLILLTVGLGEAARLAKLLNVFGLTSPPGGSSTNPEVPA